MLEKNKEVTNVGKVQLTTCFGCAPSTHLCEAPLCHHYNH